MLLHLLSLYFFKGVYSFLHINSINLYIFLQHCALHSHQNKKSPLQCYSELIDSDMQTKQGGDDDKHFGIQAWKTNISRHSGRLAAVTLVAMCTFKSILRPFLTTILHVSEHDGSCFTLYKFHVVAAQVYQSMMRKMYFSRLRFVLHILIFRRRLRNKTVQDNPNYHMH